MSNVFSYRIQAGFGATENFGFSTLMLSWKGHLELLGKTEEAWLEVEDAWRGFQQMRSCACWCGGDLEGISDSRRGGLREEQGGRKK